MSPEYRAWLRLQYYIDHELAEDEITKATHNAMSDSLMVLKRLVDQEEE